MKARHVGLFLLAGSPAAVGCTIMERSAYNVRNEIQLFAQEVDVCHDLKSQAKETWQDYKAAHPDECFSRYFEDGFRDGFKDYLDSGGNGEPPATPPIAYRNQKFLTPEGFVAIEDYFSGFRVGTRVAYNSGIRDTLVVPVIVPLGRPLQTYRSQSSQSPAAPSSTNDSTGAEKDKDKIETLPLPRSVDDVPEPKKPTEK